uniref:hypothetical protein n=1 Tax=Acidiplasma aeolicum TaxID=507754 RepID=UPI0037171B2A
MITIELITRGEKTTENVLRSISSQTFNSFDVVCVNSSGIKEISKLLSDYGVKEITANESTQLLQARYLANLNSPKNPYTMILDSTRTLEPNALEVLMSKYSKFSAVCVREGSEGQGFWVEQAKKLKLLSENSYEKVKNNFVAYLLPRFYKSNVLDNSFNFLKSNIPEELFVQIGYGEHNLIFED